MQRYLELGNIRLGLIAALFSIGLADAAFGNNYHLTHPLVLLLAFVLAGLLIVHLIRQPNALRFDVLTIVLLLGALLPVLHGHLADAFVLSVMLLSVRVYDVRFEWVFIALGVIAGLASLVLELFIAPHLLLIAAALIIHGIDEPPRALYAVYALIAGLLIFSLNWGAILLLFVLVLSALGRHSLTDWRTLLLVFPPLLLLLILVPLSNSRSANMLDNVVEGIPLQEWTGLVLTAYRPTEDSPILRTDIPDVELDGQRYATVALDVPPFSTAQIQYELDLPTDSGIWLRLSLARLDESPQPLWFSVDVISTGAQRVLTYQHDPFDRQQWTDFIVDLSEFAGEHVILVLGARTAGEQPAQAIWGKLRLAQSPDYALISRDITPRIVARSAGAIAGTAPLEALVRQVHYNGYTLRNRDINWLIGDGDLRPDESYMDALHHLLQRGLIGVMFYLALIISSIRAIEERQTPHAWVLITLLLYSLWAGVLSLPLIYAAYAACATTSQSATTTL